MLRDLKINAGDTKVISVGLQTPERTTVSLVDAEIKFQIARRVDTTPLVVKSVGSGITIVDAGLGLFEVLLLPEDTDALGGKIYYYEIEVTFADGTVTTALNGDIDIQKTLIRSV